MALAETFPIPFGTNVCFDGFFVVLTASTFLPKTEWGQKPRFPPPAPPVFRHRGRRWGATRRHGSNLNPPTLEAGGVGKQFEGMGAQRGAERGDEHLRAA